MNTITQLQVKAIWQLSRLYGDHENEFNWDGPHSDTEVPSSQSTIELYLEWINTPQEIEKKIMTFASPRCLLGLHRRRLGIMTENSCYQ